MPEHLPQFAALRPRPVQEVVLHRALDPPGIGLRRFLRRQFHHQPEAAMRRDLGLKFAIEIDGGVTQDNIGEVIRAGVDWAVAGASVYGKSDPAAAFQALQKEANAALAVRV